MIEVIKNLQVPASKPFEMPVKMNGIQAVGILIKRMLL